MAALFSSCSFSISSYSSAIYRVTPECMCKQPAGGPELRTLQDFVGASPLPRHHHRLCNAHRHRRPRILPETSVVVIILIFLVEFLFQPAFLLSSSLHITTLHLTIIVVIVIVIKTIIIIVVVVITIVAIENIFHQDCGVQHYCSK